MDGHNRFSDVDLILFDLDNTMYPRDLGLWRQIDQRIRAYVAQTLDLSADEAAAVQKRYWQTYGTTIVGLMREHDVDPAPYLHFVHDLDVAAFLQPNPALARMLQALPQRKVVFTNATSVHARNVLSALDVLDYFEALVGMEETDYVSKPDLLAYERCLALIRAAPERCLLIEDSPGNLVPAQALGMATVLVGQPQQGIADDYIDRIEDVGRLFGLDGGGEQALESGLTSRVGP